MKFLLKFIKNQELKSKLDLITELLTSESVAENIQLFKKVEANFKHRLSLENSKLKSDVASIEKFIFNKKTIDPNFDKPLSKIEINYEIVKPC